MLYPTLDIFLYYVKSQEDVMDSFKLACFKLETSVTPLFTVLEGLVADKCFFFK